MIRSKIPMITPHMIIELSPDFFSSETQEDAVDVLSNFAGSFFPE